MIRTSQRDMIIKALKKKVPPRVEVSSIEAAKEYIGMGVRHFCIRWDPVAVDLWSKQNGEGLRELLGAKKINY